jgi:phytoene desaturase
LAMSTSTSTKHVVVVGAGPGGLTAAMILAHRGFHVTVCEARDRVGGRNAELRLGPYVFDTGPTFLMLKAIMEEVFCEAGAVPDELLKVKSLDPLYRLRFRDQSLDMSSNPEAMVAEIERVCPGQSAGYAKFRRREAARFERMVPCLQKSYHRFATLFHPDMLRAIPHLALGRSLYDVMHGYFGDEKLALAFTFQAKYIGMSPWECPGVFAIIPHMEHAYGIHHVQGGLSRISDAMAETAERNGAEIRLSSPVRRVLVENRAATGVALESGEILQADDVVINADFGYAATNLFEPGLLRKHTPAAVERKRFSCSIFMLYLGLDQPVSTPHHLIVFADDYRAFVDSIFSGGQLRKDISFYVRNASLNDPTLAPPGHSALYVLVPVPNLRSAIDWNRERDAFREVVLDAIAERTDIGDLRPHIRAEKIITPADWEHDYRVYRGATFNLAHNIGQMLYLRPHNQFEELDHCYLVGGGTHPGSGLPTIYESGRIAANLLSLAHGVPFTSANIHV